MGVSAAALACQKKIGIQIAEEFAEMNHLPAPLGRVIKEPFKE